MAPLMLRWRSLSLLQRDPSRLPKMQRVFSDDAVPAAAGSLAGQEGS